MTHALRRSGFATSELFPIIFGEEGDPAIAQLQALQEELGQLHDLDVRIALIEAELSTLVNQPAAVALRLSLEAFLEGERIIRVTQHAAVVERWRQLEHEQLQARLTALTFPSD